MIRPLLWVQWRQLLRGTLRLRAVLMLVAFLPVALLFVGSLTMGAALLALSASPAEVAGIAALAFTSAMVMVLLSDLPLASQMFAGRELELLFSMPVRARAVFLTRYAETLVRSVGLAGGVLLLPCLAWGLISGASWLYFPLLPVVLLSLVSSVNALSYLLTLLLVRVVPAERAKEVLAVVVGLVGMGLALAGPLFRLATPRNGSGDPDALPGVPDIPGWLPSSWGAIALVRTARGDLSGLLLAGALVALAAGLLLLAVQIVERGFESGWAQHAQATGGPGVRGRSGRSDGGSLRPASPIAAIAVKELRVLRRDVREWVALLPLVIFMGVGVLQSSSAGFDFRHDGDWLRWLVLQATLTAMLTLFLSGFAAQAIAREGGAVWVVRTTPLSGWQIVVGKLAVYWPVALVVVALLELTLAVLAGWSIVRVVAALVTSGGLSAGLIGMGLWVGTFGGKYNPDRPMDRLQLGASFILLGLSAAYSIVATIPAVLLMLFLPEPLDSIAPALAISWMLLIAAATTALSLHLTARRIDAGVQIEIVEGR